MAKYVLLTVLVLALGCGVQQSGEHRTAQAQSDTNVQRFEVKGVVQEVKAAEKKAVIRHEEIPNYMPAMTMPLDVKNTNELTGLVAGDEITFTMVVTDDDGWIENIKKTGASQVVTPPKRPSTRLVRDVEPLEVGDKMPNYTFTNALGQTVNLSDLAGQAYAFTFIFTRCPFPTFCPRMNSNFEQVYELLSKNPNAPTNWHLLSITLDPDYDTPERLRAYSANYKGDPKKWNWLTGAMIEIDAITEQVGLAFSFENNTINHNLRTVVVDAQGIIRQIMWGNEWTAEELAEGLIAAARAKPAA